MNENQIEALADFNRNTNFKGDTMQRKTCPVAADCLDASLYADITVSDVNGRSYKETPPQRHTSERPSFIDLDPKPWWKKRDDVLAMVNAEIIRAVDKHPAFHSPHEAYGILCEEVAEVFDEVRAQRLDKDELAKELIHVAAVALRACVDLNLV